MPQCRHCRRGFRVAPGERERFCGPRCRKSAKGGRMARERECYALDCACGASIEIPVCEVVENVGCCPKCGARLLIDFRGVTESAGPSGASR
jgi:hypothetical protein